MSRVKGSDGPASPAGKKSYGSTESGGGPSWTEKSLDSHSGRKPSKVLHFSNGVIVEYEPSNESLVDVQVGEDVPDAHKSTVNLVSDNLYETTAHYWARMLARLTWSVGHSSLQVCDYIGEKVARFMGITAPKYQSEIEEYQRSADAEVAYKDRIDKEYAGWRIKKDPKSLKQTDVILFDDGR